MEVARRNWAAANGGASTANAPGFSLIELLSALAIMSLLLALELNSTVGAATAAGRAEGRKELAVLQPGLPGAASGTVLKVVSAPLPARRLSWREVANWRELHEAAKKK